MRVMLHLLVAVSLLGTSVLHAGDTKEFVDRFNRANELFRSNKIPASIEAYKSAIAIKDDIAEAHFNLGLALEREGETEEAIISYRRATKLKPDYTKAHQHYGNILVKQKRYKEAITPLNTACEHNPNSVDAHHQIARAYSSLNQFDNADSHYRQALELRSDSPALMLDYANMLNMNNRTERALDFYLKILDVVPDNPSLLYNIAYTLKKLNRIDEAMPYYERVLEKRPNHTEAHFSLSLAYLVRGDFKRGWPEYEWRWKKDEGVPARNFAQPLWDGSDLTGKTILLHAEQGLGDTFQFIRYAQAAKQRGARIIAAVQRALVDIISQCPYIDVVAPLGQFPSDYDVQAPLMSLPYILKNDREDLIPDDVPYLHADPDLVEEWRIKLNTDNNFKIGLCWQGNPNYSTQFLRAAVAAKSIPLHLFEPLTKIPGVTVYSLQRKTGTEQLDKISDEFKEKLYVFGDDFDSTHGRFMDTAAVIKNLDLMITIDTSMAHIAAGLGTPTWNLVPNPPDWRWMLERNDTPWYPNMRLFRQPTPGDWESVIKEIVEELKKSL